MSDPIERYDIYGPIHRGLRLGLTETLIALGRADDGSEAVERALGLLETQLELNASHLRNEDIVIHPELLAKAQVIHRALEAAHDLHRDSIARLRTRIAAVRSAGPPRRRSELRQLYLEFSIFVAEDFLHMANEELVVLPAVQAILTDEQLAELEGRIISGIADDELYQDLRLMLRAADPAGRAALQSAINAAVNPAVAERLRSSFSNDNIVAIRAQGDRL